MKALSFLSFVVISASGLASDLHSKDAHLRFFERKDYAGGVSAYGREIAAHPTDVVLLTGLGQLQYTFAKYDDSKAALERALAIDPAHPVARNFLGLVYSQTNHPAAALAELDLAIKADPAYADAHFNRAVVLATGQPPDKVAAKVSYDRAIALGCARDEALEQLIK